MFGGSEWLSCCFLADPVVRSTRPGGQTRGMSNPEIQEHPQVLVVGPDGIARSGDPQDEGGERPVTEMVEPPAKVMRMGSMISELLEEVRAAPLDEKSRARLKAIHESSIKELEDGLAPELVSELERLTLPFTEEELPSEGELRRALRLLRADRAFPLGTAEAQPSQPRGGLGELGVGGARPDLGGAAVAPR